MSYSVVSWVCELFPNMWSKPSQRSWPGAARVGSRAGLSVPTEESGVAGGCCPGEASPSVSLILKEWVLQVRRHDLSPRGPEWQTLLWVTEELREGVRWDLLPSKFQILGPLLKEGRSWSDAKNMHFVSVPSCFSQCSGADNPRRARPCVPTPCSRYPGTPFL